MYVRQSCGSHGDGVVGLLALILLALPGCGGKDIGPTGTVSGKVTYKTEPVPEESTIQFYQPETGFAAAGTVKPDGTYALRSPDGLDIRAGTYQVSVIPPVQQMPDDAAVEPPQPQEYPNIPEKYRSAKTSGETFEVKEGENTFDLDMTD